ncbi:TPA_asm: tapemeasure [Anelosimus tangle-web spider MELD virus]|nr:TPA_asm: tapemeasure [Anelosimus tangle-web spider MELD virus]
MNTMNIDIRARRNTINNRVWFYLVCNYDVNNLRAHELQELYLTITHTWREYYRMYIQNNFREFIGMQGSIRLATNAVFNMQMNRAYYHWEHYIRELLIHLRMMANGERLNSANINFLISGDENYEPEDARSGTITLKFGFDFRHRNVLLPDFSISEPFGEPSDEEEEEQPPPEEPEPEPPEEEPPAPDDEPPEDQHSDDFEEQVQQDRRNELTRRIENLESLIQELQNQLNDNNQYLIDLRATRRRFNRFVLEERRRVEQQNRQLNNQINQLRRNLRALIRLRNLDIPLSPRFDPDTEEYQVQDLLDNSLNLDDFFNVSGEFPELSDNELSDLMDYLQLDNSPEDQVLSEEDQVQIEYQNQVSELNNEIQEHQYELDQIADALRDLRGRRVRRNTTSYRNLLADLETQKNFHTRELQSCRRRLRNLQRNAP